MSEYPRIAATVDFLVGAAILVGAILGVGCAVYGTGEIVVRSFPRLEMFASPVGIRLLMGFLAGICAFLLCAVVPSVAEFGREMRKKGWRRQ